jgi:cytochrome c-type biogenesis protein CcmH/NrfF
VRRALPEIVETTGGLVLVIGLALWSIPVAVIVAGLLLVVAAQFVPRGETPTEEDAETVAEPGAEPTA